MFLDKIKIIKEEELKNAKLSRHNVFANFLKNDFNIIAEIKKASPSKGDIAPNIDIIETAKGYLSNGAVVISVLTEEKFFKGNINYLKEIRQKFSQAVLLRKDFIIDPYQIYEAKFYGADMILLIFALLGFNKTVELLNVANSLGLEVLLEVHNEKEMIEALKTKAHFIGVNNRDLKTLEVNLETSVQLSKYITKDRIFVCESGLNDVADIIKMQKLGYKAFLIGTSLMKKEYPEDELKRIIKGVCCAKG